MMCVIKFVNYIQAFGFKIEPKIIGEFNWNPNDVCDSDWIGNPEMMIT
jgi:hypothetical protein